MESSLEGFHSVSSHYLTMFHAPFLLAFSCIYIYIGAFEDEDVTHVEGDVNPVRDLEIISEELRLKDIDYVSKRVVREIDIIIHPLPLLLYTYVRHL